MGNAAKGKAVCAVCLLSYLCEEQFANNLCFNILLDRPKVHSYKDLQRATFTMYDAVPSSSSLASLASPNPASGVSPGKMDVDPDVEKFLPLLQDYLRSMSFNSPCTSR